MKKQQIKVATVVGFVMVGSIAVVAPAEASSFSDVKRTAEYYKAVTEFAKKGYVSGYADGSFKPNLKMTRGQFVGILSTILDLNVEQQASTYFVDMNSKNSFNSAAIALANAGIDVAYEDGSFQPRKAITRYEAAHMLAQAYELVATKKSAMRDVRAGYEQTVNAIIETGIMKGRTSTRFEGDQALTRGLAIQAIYLAQQYVKKQEYVEYTIADVAETAVVTSDAKKIRFAKQFEKIFNQDNSAALKEAVIKVRLQNKQIVEIVSLQLATPYTFFSSQDLKIPEVIVQADAIHLSNLVVSKQLTIGEEVSHLATLEKTTMLGALVVEASYKPLHLKMKDVSAKRIELNRDDTVLDSNRTLTTIAVGKSVNDLVLNAKLKKLDLPSSSYLTLGGYLAIEQASIGRRSTVNLAYTGLVEHMTIADRNTNVTLAANAFLGKVIIPKDVEYSDILWARPSSVLATNIKQIARVETDSNFLAPQKPPVINPLAETYEEALKKAIVNFQVTSEKNEIHGQTIFGQFNEARLVGASFDSSIKLVSGLADVSATTEYTFTLKRNGQVVTTKKAPVSTLHQGVRLSTLMGIPTAQLLDYKGMSQDQWTLEIVELEEEAVFDLMLLVKNKIIDTKQINVPGKKSEETASTTLTTSFVELTKPNIATLLQLNRLVFPNELGALAMPFNQANAQEIVISNTTIRNVLTSTVDFL